MSHSPFISIIIPCRNEEALIGQCLKSIVRQDYPKNKLEVLIVDGISQDKTRDIIRTYIKKYPFIKMINNTKRITPAAFNLGIKYSKGELIVLLGSHNIYQKDYLSQSVKYLKKYQADNVGGVIKVKPRQDTLINQAITASLAQPFGSGNSRYRLGLSKPQWVDTVFGGCYKKQVFQKIGLFNEKLVHSQDIEFNLRLKKAGGKILCHPHIVSYYYPLPTTLKSFFLRNYKNGFWAIYPLKFTNHLPVSLRHLMPLAAFLSLLVIAALTLFYGRFLWLFIGVIGLYFLLNLFYSWKTAWQKKDFRFGLVMPVVFLSLHLGYGLGSMWGLIKLIQKTNGKTEKN